LYDPETRRFLLADELANGRIADMGDVDIRPAAVEVSFGLITEAVRQILARGALPVVLGGDHAITFPVLRAFSEPLYVLHFDAHTDFAPFAHGLRYTNSHAFRHIIAMPTLLGLTQIGIRSLRHTPEQVDEVEQTGHRIIGMNEFRRLGPSGVSAHIPDGARCYVSIDVDALDISLVPGCVSAEPNGLSYAELRDALAAIASRLTVVGFDFVEVNPLLDVGTGVTAYLGAHTVIEFLGRICAAPPWRARS
jgi:agmatinase